MRWGRWKKWHKIHCISVFNAFCVKWKCVDNKILYSLCAAGADTCAFYDGRVKECQRTFPLFKKTFLGFKKAKIRELDKKGLEITEREGKKTSKAFYTKKRWKFQKTLVKSLMRMINHMLMYILRLHFPNRYSSLWLLISLFLLRFSWKKNQLIAIFCCCCDTMRVIDIIM